MAGKFDKEKVEINSLQNELALIKCEADCLKQKDLSIDGDSTCFWLNIVNYMILMKIAELLVCNKDTLK